jgi:hypothetical protein
LVKIWIQRSFRILGAWIGYEVRAVERLRDLVGEECAERRDLERTLGFPDDSCGLEGFDFPAENFVPPEPGEAAEVARADVPILDRQDDSPASLVLGSAAICIGRKRAVLGFPKVFRTKCATRSALNNRPSLP